MNATGTITIDDFGELYGKYGPMVLRRCRFLLKDEERALDCMQDTFVRIIERRERLSGVCSSLFYTVATSVCLNRIRSDRLRRGPQIENLLHEIEDSKSARHEEIVDTAALLDQIFEDTKDDTRTMAVLHYVDGLTLEETAEEMRMSVSGVRKRLAVLRKKALRDAGTLQQGASK
ncbi:MAG: sigma-70 family RNA polymerase sigma factor [Spirochaetales bacterium]|nr:sigma-70 family RNA polymerase sigma factor [Spirochaetales bacterium]HPO03532.1 sigma-70 family RNA polymerase sigma factor [Treponemataceae bacterium]